MLITEDILFVDVDDSLFDAVNTRLTSLTKQSSLLLWPPRYDTGHKN